MRQLADINLFAKFKNEVFTKLNLTSALLQSDLVKEDATLKSLMSGKGTGTFINLPFVKRTVGRTWTSGSDNSADIVAQDITSGSGKVYTTFRNISVGTATILDTIEKEGISFNEAATLAIADERNEMLESKLVSIIEGIIAAAELAGTNVNDILTDVISYNSLIDTEALSYNNVEYIVMNKKTKAVLIKDNAVGYLPKEKSINKDFDTIDGKKLIISKKMADGVIAMFEKGAILNAEIEAANGTMAYVENDKANGGSGSKEVIYRNVNAMTVDGFSFEGTPADGFDVTDVEFATGSNWEMQCSVDECPFVVLKGTIVSKKTLI